MSVGRPTSFTPETIIVLLDAISRGATYEMSCDAAGICFATFRKWVIAGEQGDEKYVEFLKELKRAKGRSAVKWLKALDDAIDNEVWQAAAWKLERRFPKDFSANSGVLELAEELREFREMKNKSQGESNAVIDSRESQENPLD